MENQMASHSNVLRLGTSLDLFYWNLLNVYLDRAVYKNTLKYDEKN